LSISRAAASASASVLRRSSFSSSRTRRASPGLACMIAGVERPESAAWRHAARSVSCTPLRRRNSPRPASPRALASSTRRSFSSALRSSGRFCAEDPEGGVAGGLRRLVKLPSLVACSRHRVKVVCPTPVSRLSAQMLPHPGISILCTSFCLIDSEYTAYRCSPPKLETQPLYGGSGDATTSLTQRDPQGAVRGRTW
jgi:hypothetical protein